MIYKHPEPNTCFNCEAHCENLHEVPEFGYLGCDDCMEEALRVIAAEAAATANRAERQQLAIAKLLREVA